MSDDTYIPRYSLDEIEDLIRRRFHRARSSNDPSIRKRANRNIQKFLLELSRDDIFSDEQEVISLAQGILPKEHQGSGTLFGLIALEVDTATVPL